MPVWITGPRSMYQNWAKHSTSSMRRHGCLPARTPSTRAGEGKGCLDHFSTDLHRYMILQKKYQYFEVTDRTFAWFSQRVMLPNCHVKFIYEPRREKTGFLHNYAKTKTQISFAVTAKLISAFVFAT